MRGSGRPLAARPLAAQLTAALAAAGLAGAAAAGGMTRLTAFSAAPGEPAADLAPALELEAAPVLPLPDPASQPLPPPTGPPSGETAPGEEPLRRSAAERRTEEELAPLYDAGWRFVHDVAAPVGNFDHIAIGPAGVVLIESRQPAGSVVIEAGAPVVTPSPGSAAFGPGTDELHNLRPRTLADAAALREELQRLAAHRVWVQAMVVFWSEFPAGCVIDGRIVFIHGSRLSRWLSRRPPQLNPAEIETVYGIVKALPGATTAEPAGATVTPLRVVS